MGVTPMDDKTARTQKSSAKNNSANRKLPLFGLAAIMTLLLGGSCPAFLQPAAAQSAAGPIAPNLNQRSQNQSSQNIRVRVNLVNTPAVVHDSKGNLVLNLTQNNFRILDNGVQQKVEGFDMGGAPISLAIVVETSSRVEALLPAIQRTGSLFSQTVLGEDGEAAVITYND